MTTTRAEIDSPRLLIDNSVWQRQAQPEVRSAMTDLLDSRSPLDILICPPIVAEVGFSARSGPDHDAVRGFLAEFPECDSHPSVDLVLAVQNALFRGGLVRAVGALDTVIAAYAIANDAAVVHYDRDFERVARVWPDFRHTWIAPRGSLTA
jgi:predicted nucleic acid-binding protein